MKLGEYKNKGTLRQATLVLLFKDNQILLAMKKRGFGKGKWNGVGGKLKEGETIEDAAKRETQEEIGVSISTLTKVCDLSFYFSNKSDWNQEVTVYKVDEWLEEPKESEEMAPKWFSFEEIPYDSMWWDDRYWLPMVIQGKKVKADFLFGEDEKIADMEISEIM